MINLQKKPIGEMHPCPNCKEHTIPYSFEAGLLSDWCTSCNKSIFDDSDDVQLPCDTYDGGIIQEP